MKKIISFFVCMNLCITLAMPVSAAEIMPKENVIEKEEASTTLGSNSFSKVLPKLSSVNGTASKIVTFSTGSTSGSAQITSIKLYVRVASGSSPFILNMQAPDGTTYSFVITKSETIILDNFNGCDLSGSWKIWIETQGTASTADITVTLNYSY